MKKKTPKYIELDIESSAFEGVSVARNEGKVFFVKGAVPGDKVIAEIHRSKKSYAECSVKEILQPSPERIEPECEYFGVCGGCSWQNLKYESQTYWKSVHVKDAFERIGKFKDFELKEIIKSEIIYNFRNKMEFTFGASRWLTIEEIESNDEIESKHFALGLHLPGRYDKILDLNYCKIQNEYGNQILNNIRTKALELNLDAYSVKSHEGFLRGLIIRHSVTNDDFMIILITNLITNDAEESIIDWLRTEFADKFLKAATIVHAINVSRNPVDIEKYNIIKGNGKLTENILGVDFYISPSSFFQTNSYQLNTFIGGIIDIANIKLNQIIWDLYCGAGSITLTAAKFAKQIIGIELSKQSVIDAQFNAEANGINNVDFYCEDLHSKDIPDMLKTLPFPDTIIIDPPRAGMHTNLIAHLLTVESPNIVYVSCNPATQARDCQLLSEKYELISIQPVDMFPQTYHIESIALLKKI
jgi:23S rRNA (uracil1939-C5)-methyltransferase